MARVGTAKSESLYGVHPGVAMMQKWVALLLKEAPEGHQKRREWLKTKHKLGSNSAWWLADRAEGKGGDEDSPEAYLKTAEKYVEQQYSGAKTPLRPVYDELLRLGKSTGPDVKACPCQTIVPLYRNHVFAQIKPTTNTRIDLGFALAHYKGKLPKRLIDTGGLQKKDRITHRLEIKSMVDIDEDVKKWLQTAYELDGKA